MEVSVTNKLETPFCMLLLVQFHVTRRDGSRSLLPMKTEMD